MIRAIKISFSKDKKLFYSIKNIFGFFPGNISLYKLAFRHKSVLDGKHNTHKDCNERLEFLGDAILGAVIADYLFKKFPTKDEGFLTEMRSKIVNRGSLNKLSLKLGIVDLFNYKNDPQSRFYFMPGNMFEAFIGAVYVDKGYNFVKRLIVDFILKYHVDTNDLETKEFDFKTKMINWAQKEKKNFAFKVVEEKGTGYQKTYVVEFLLENLQIGKGEDSSIKRAEQRAAQKAYESIQNRATSITA